MSAENFGDRFCECVTRTKSNYNPKVIYIFRGNLDIPKIKKFAQDDLHKLHLTHVAVAEGYGAKISKFPISVATQLSATSNASRVNEP